MGDLVRLNGDADVEPGDDVLDAVQAWVEHLRAGAIGRPLTAILIIEGSDGRTWWAADSTLPRCDLARKLGIVDLTAARMRANADRFMDQDLPAP